MKKLLPLHEMAENLGLVNKSMMPKRGRKSYFTPEGKVALMFLKMKTQMSFPKLMEELNWNIHYQLFCDILIDPTHPLKNYKLLDDIAAEMAGSLKIQELQNLLAEAWKPYMKNLDTMFTDRERQMFDIITKVYRQQHNHFRSGDALYTTLFVTGDLIEAPPRFRSSGINDTIS